MRISLIVAVACFASIACAAEPKADAEGFVPLFNGKDLAGWVPVQVGPSTFTVKDGMIICDGKPTGVMRTDKQYENFVVEVEWRHMNPKGNAGFFVWSDPVTARGQPFTRSIEVQVLDGPNGEWYTTHGDVFPIHGARMTPENGRGGDRAYPTEHRSKPSPEWNHYRVECRDGNLSLAVNGKVVTTGRGCSPRKGYICLESEGGVVHWRNMRIKELPPGEKTLDAKDVAQVDRGFKSIYTGVDLSGWKTADGVGEHWKSSDWTFWYDGKGGAKHQTLWTEKELGDYELIVDYRTEPKADGAEVAVFALGEKCEPIRLNAGIVGAGKPGDWNRFTATVRGGRITTAALNGQQMVKNVFISESKHGPLGLRANTQTQFANVYVRPLE